jgi:hypothetical protein
MIFDTVEVQSGVSSGSKNIAIRIRIWEKFPDPKHCYIISMDKLFGRKNSTATELEKKTRYRP